ncbi:FMN-binding protein [Bacteroidota bacterium]
MKRAVFIILAFTSLSSANEIKNKTEEMLKLFFGDNHSAEMEEYIIPIDIKKSIEFECKQKFFGESVYLWEIYEGTELKGYAILDNVYGKSLPITFLVLFDIEGRIIKSTVLKYRESYGGAVQNENWQAQFEGKDHNSKFTIGEDIDAVSGATISGQSITAGVRKLALLIPHILDE